MVSFDYGEKFIRLEAPPTDHRGKDINCGNQCFLNIHMYSSAKQYPLPKTTAGIPGFIMASGNVGEYLSDDSDDVDIY